MTKKSIPYIGGKIEVAFNKADELPVSIQIYDDIGKDPWTGEGFSAKDLANALKEIPNRNRELRIAVNSRGGDVNEGKTIRSMLEDWPGRIVNVIDGVAASTASWMIPADEVHARNHSQIFIHKSWAMVMGNSNDMTKAVAMLNTTDEQIADIYASKTGRGREAMMKLMTDETLLTGQTALELGLVDKLIDGNPVHNFTEVEIQNMKGKLAAMNSLKLSAPTQGADQQQKQQEKIMETENKALLTEQANRIAELENKVKAERASRIESAFNTLAATRPTLNREEWLPKCQADESVLNLAAKFPESPVAGNIASGVSVGRNALVEKYENLAHDKVEQAKLAKGLYNDIRKQLMIANGVKDADILNGKFDRFDFSNPKIVNANTVDAALANTVLSGEFVTTMRTYIAPWAAFTRTVSLSPVSRRQVLEVPLYSSAGSKQQNATNYESGDSVLAPIAVTVAEESKSFHVSRPESNLGLQLAGLVPTNAKVLAEGIHAKMTALMIAANYGAATIIGTAANFDSADLPAILALGKNYDSCRLLLDGGHLAYLLPTTRESFQYGEAGAYGFDGGIYKNNLWTSGVANICGFVCGPDAIVNAWGVADGLPAGEAISQTTMDVNGIPFTMSVWFSRSTRAVWASFQVMHGCAVGDATQAENLVTA